MRDVFVYGAGFFGRELHKKIASYYPDINILGYIDEKKTGKLFDIPIIRLEDYTKQNVPVIIALENRKAVKQVYGGLCKSGATKIYMYQNRSNPRYNGNEFLPNECVRIIGDEDQIVPHIETHAVDYCNLNCKACIHFSALYKKEEQDTSAIYCDIDKISKLSKSILSFYIMGGEPLLREDLTDLVELSRKSFPNSDIQLLTNGILLPSCKEPLLKALYNNNVTVTVSEYYPTRVNRDRIIDILESYEVPYIIRPYDSKSKFIKTLSLDRDVPYKNICICDGCVNIYKGRIARCPAVMYIDKLNETFSLELPNDGIYQIDDFNDIGSLNMKMEEPIPLCKHCVEYEVDWEQCGKTYKIEDFVVV